jgi:hypothetical protein
LQGKYWTTAQAALPASIYSTAPVFPPQIKRFSGFHRTFHCDRCLLHFDSMWQTPYQGYLSSFVKKRRSLPCDHQKARYSDTALWNAFCFRMRNNSAVQIHRVFSIFDTTCRRYSHRSTITTGHWTAAVAILDLAATVLASRCHMRAPCKCVSTPWMASHEDQTTTH